MCIMLGVRPEVNLKDPAAKITLESYWNPSKELLKDPANLFMMIFEYDKANIPKFIMDKLDTKDFLRKQRSHKSIHGTVSQSIAASLDSSASIVHDVCAFSEISFDA